MLHLPRRAQLNPFAPIMMFLTFFLVLTSSTAFTAIQHYARTKSAVAALPDTLEIPSVEDAAEMATSLSASASLPSLESLTASTDPLLAILAAVAIGIIAIAVLAFSGGGAVAEPVAKKTTAAAAAEPEPIDVSIPYNAAAILSYCQYKGVHKISDPADFADFEAKYIDATVAQVTLKKMKRELAEMEAVVAAKLSALGALKAEM